MSGSPADSRQPPGLADDLPVMLWAGSADGARTWFNRAWSAFTGRVPEEERGDAWRDSVHPDDRERVREACAQAVAERREFSLEYRFRNGEGEYRHLLDSATPRFDADGRFEGHAGACVDVTARRLVAERLAETSDQLEALIEALPDAVVFKNADGRWRWANGAARRLLGLSDQAWRARTDAELAALRPAWGAAHRALEAADARAWAQAEGACDSVDLLPDGNGLARFFEASRVIVRDALGRPRGLVTLGRNATARRRAEEALRLAASVFENNQDGIMITDAESRILRVNRAFSEITGFAPDEVLGRTPRLLSSGRHGADFYAVMWRALAQTGAWRGEIWNRRKSGEVYPEWLSIVAVQDDAGRVSRYIGTFSDITGRKRAEEQLQRLAFHDGLTGLANRRLCEQDLERRTGAGSAFVLALVDLDGFRAVNAMLGHAAGDRVLEEAGRRIADWLPPGGVAARWSADEFALLLPAPSGAGQGALHLRLAELAEALRRPHDRACGVVVTASFGLSVWPRDGRLPADLVRAAEAALRDARGRGPGALVFDSGA